MKYLEKSFTVHPASEPNYRNNYDAIFGKKKPKHSTKKKAKTAK